MALSFPFAPTVGTTQYEFPSPDEIMYAPLFLPLVLVQHLTVDGFVDDNPPFFLGKAIATIAVSFIKSC
ncbi:MAG: hypothetical protein RMX65_019590 [Nostoc sp. DedQUE01]|nr:hypothetical protein [Nostoc sp. DedQUE01]